MITCGCSGCFEMDCIDCINGNIIEHMEVCQECGGEGFILHHDAEHEHDGFDCPFCNGKGLMNEKELDCYQRYQGGKKDAYNEL